MQDQVIELETRPDDPYSVQVNAFVRNGKLYVDPNEGRNWLEHLRADPRVRVRIAGKVYALRAVLLDDAKERAGFEEGAFVYRLERRSRT